MGKKSTRLFQEEATGVDIEKEKATDNTLPEVDGTDGEVSSVDNDTVQNIDLSILKRKKFSINGDPTKIIELNPSDMSIAVRLNETYPKLNKLMDDISDEISKSIDSDNDEDLEKASGLIKKMDNKMREYVDYIFDANVSEVCASDGSMWDPIEGAFRYEHIIDRLSTLYESNLNREFTAMKRRVEGRASRYNTVKKYHR